MKIIIPILDFGRSGGYRVISNLATEWKRKGHDVRFVCATTDSVPYYPTEADISYAEPTGAQRLLAGLTKNKTVKKIISLCALSSHIRQRERRDAVFIATHNITTFPILLAGRIKRCVYYIQAYEPEMIIGRRASASAQRLAARLSYILPTIKIVNSPLYLDYKEIKALHFVPPGIDFRIFKPDVSGVAAGKDSQSSAYVIGCVGRSELSKGTVDVVAAFKELKQRGVNVVLAIAAYSGNYDELHPNPSVRIELPKDDLQLAAFYRGLDVLIAPGTIQLGAAHYPVLEAMACEVPVITTDYIPANVDNAWLVPVSCPESIADAVVNCMENRDNITKQKVRASSIAIRQFGWEEVAEKFLHIIGSEKGLISDVGL